MGQCLAVEGGRVIVFITLENYEEETELLFSKLEGLRITTFKEIETSIGTVFLLKKPDEAGRCISRSLGATCTSAA